MSAIPNYYSKNLKIIKLKHILFSTALSFPIAFLASPPVSAQTPAPYGAGKGGDEGKYVDGNFLPGVVGEAGDGGNGGGSNGGDGGLRGRLINESGQLDDNVIGGEGLSGTINAISDRATSGGGGGGGTGIIIGDEDGGDSLEVDINTTIKGGNGGNGGNAALALGAGGSGGDGGAGVYIYKSLVINNGTIIGGNGGSGGNSVGETAIAGKGGDGGVGVLIGKDSQLINNKYIKGGMGGLQGISTDDSSHPSINKGGNGVELLGNNHLENTISGEIYGGLERFPA